LADASKSGPSSGSGFLLLGTARKNTGFPKNINFLVTNGGIGTDMDESFMMRNIVLLAAASLAVASHAQVVLEQSTFDVDAENWFKEGSDTVSYSSTGGNPGGYMDLTDTQGGQTDLSNTTQFAGDYASMQVSGLHYDHIIFAVGSPVNGYLPYQVVLSGGSNQATWTGATTDASLEGTWQSISVPIDTTAAGADWTVNSGTWTDLMANVEKVSIRIEHVDGGTNGSNIEGLDNVKLEAVPEPATMLALGAGLAALARRRKK
jgi:hypothetical protein